MANLSFGGVEFGVRSTGRMVPQTTRQPDGPRKLSLTLEFSAAIDYSNFLALRSIVDWHRPLGLYLWSYVVQAGHGPDTLVIPTDGMDTTTYTEAFLVRTSADADLGHNGRLVVKADFEIK